MSQSFGKLIFDMENLVSAIDFKSKKAKKCRRPQQWLPARLGMSG
jgi:hypothetical protein